MERGGEEGRRRREGKGERREERRRGREKEGERKGGGEREEERGETLELRSVHKSNETSLVQCRKIAKYKAEVF